MGVATFSLIGCYAPANAADRPTFLAELTTIERSETQIWLGDFNMIATPGLDSTNANRIDNWAPMAQILTDFDLVDAFRTQKPNDRAFTHKSAAHGTLSRIDYVFVPRSMIAMCLDQIIDQFVLPAQIDHSLVGIEFTLPEFIDRGTGRWSIKKAMLENEQFHYLIRHAVKKYDMICQDMTVIKAWEELKLECGVIARRLERQTSQRQKRQRTTLQAKVATAMAELTGSQESMERLNQAKKELAEFDLINNERKLMQSYGKYLEEGERPSRYFYRSLKHRQGRQRMARIIDSDGMEHNGPDEVIAAAHTYYSNVFDSQLVDSSVAQRLFANVHTRVKPEKLGTMNSMPTREEVESLIKEVPVSKAAGIDGITGEFYRTFGEMLLPILYDVFVEIVETKQIPESFRQSLIVLLHKKGSRESMANWRPISLDNVDAKLFSSFLLRRVLPSVSDLIHEDQVGFIPGRLIYNHIHTLHMILEEAANVNESESESTRKMRGAALLLDQEKAYDRLEWQFMIEALKNYGITGKWLELVTDYYSSSASGWLLINGFQSQRLNINRGLRQGNPLSPILYNLAFEPLLATIRARINGVICKGINFKVQAFADDTLPFLANPEDHATLEATLDEYKQASGSNVNDNKCILIPFVGDDQTWPDRFPRLEEGQTTWYLGARYGRKGLAHEQQESTLKTALTRRLEAWKDRKLSVIGRVRALNTMLLSMVWFASYFTAFSTEFQEWIKKSVSDFIWKYRKQPRVNREDMCLPRQSGGLALMSFRAQVDGLRLRWWQGVWDPRNTTKWAMLSRQIMADRIDRDIRSLLYKDAPWPSLAARSNVTPYWKMLVQSWNRIYSGLRVEEPPSMANILFKPANTALQRPDSSTLSITQAWAKAGILAVSDVLFYADGSWEFRRDDAIRTRLANAATRGELRIHPNIQTMQRTDDTPRNELPLITVAEKPLLEARAWNVRLWARKGIQPRQPSFTSQVPASKVWKVVFHKKIIPKEQSLLYQLQVNAFFTRMRLNKAYPEIDPTCQRCHDHFKTRRHRFESCYYVRDFWTQFQRLIFGSTTWMSMDEMWTQVLTRNGRHTEVKATAFGSAIFFLHRNHTQFIYQNTWIEPANLARLWMAELNRRIKACRGQAVRTGTLVAFDGKWSGVAHRLREELL